MYIRCILCLFFLFFAVVEDVQYRRIPNEVVLCGAAAGFLTCGSLYTSLRCCSYSVWDISESWEWAT